MDEELPAELDTEATLLCAALWLRDTTRARLIAEHVHAADFTRPAHAMIYAAWQRQVRAGQPHDAATVLARLTAAGTDEVPRTVHTALRGIITLGAEPTAAASHALDVITAAYRRSYTALAATIAHAAEAAATDELFGILVEHGRRQRTQADRLHTLRRTLGADPNDEGAAA